MIMAKKKKLDTKKVEQTKVEEKPKHPGGRPTIYTDELAETICNELSDGNSLLDICERDEMPARRTVYKWRAERKEFMHKLARARKLYGLSVVDKLKKMADNLHDKLDKAADDKFSNDRLRALSDVTKSASNIYMWIAGKSYPKLFGDNSRQTVKTDLTIKDKDNVPISERISRIIGIAKNKKTGGEQ